jgi:hypothetical protein
MKPISASQVNKKIASLPQNLLQEVDHFIDFIINNPTDWAETLSEYHSALIEKGKRDIEEGRVISDKEARQRIKEYIRSKTL